MSNSFILTPGRPDILSRCLNFLSSLPLTKRWEVTIKPAKSKRSLQQNRFFHGVIVPTFCDYSGYTPAEGKEVLKYLCAPRVVITLPLMDGVDPNGREREVAKGTSDMDTEEFSQFCERCIAWLAEEGVVLPPAPWEDE